MEDEERRQSLLWAFRSRPKPTGDLEIKEAAEEISSRIKIINQWYDRYQGDLWVKMKTVGPDLTTRVLDCLDDIDASFEKWKDGSGTWEEAEYAVRCYAKAWHEIAVAYR